MREFFSQIEKPKPRSVAAFLFLPQFHRSFAAFSHIKPTFMQIIATVLEQAGLLNYNHPALRYGEPGVPHVSLNATIQEAWFNLRNLPAATPYQYSIFGVVVSVIAMAFILPLAFFANVIFGVSAQAQIFTNPHGASSPPPGFSGPSPMIQGASTHPDYAIDILNKVIAQAANNSGGPLQNALVPLLGVFNLAVMIIAAFVVFWAILSIVVDTARTGQVGGQRHNMTWAPIRFVFGLALIIPLGGGMSSGQYIMLKVAELGSNLGSYGWQTYVASATGQYLGAPPMPQHNMMFWADYTKMILCKNAYNHFYDKSVHNGDTAANHVTTVATNEGPYRVVRFTNKADAAMCGVFKSLRPSYTPPGYSPMSGPAADTIRTYHQAVIAAENSAYNSQAPIAIELANSFLASQINGYPAGSCGGSYGSAPDATCLVDMTNGFITNWRNGIQTAANTAIASGNTAIVQEATGHGWLGMGVFLEKIATLNNEIKKLMVQTAVLEPPAIEGKTLLSAARVGGGMVAGAMEMTGAISSHELETSKMIIKFDDWWMQAVGATTPTAANQEALDSGKSAWQKLKSFAASATSILDGLTFEGLMAKVFKMENAGLALQIKGSSTNVYPIEDMIGIGAWLIGFATGVTAVIFGLSFLPKAQGVMSGPVGGLLGTINGFLWFGGFAIVFILPMIPWIKVLFSALAWITSVVEAIVMVPLIGLMCLNTEGEGMGAGGKQAMQTALNVLFRPILTVIGFVLALLILNAMIMYVNDSFKEFVNASTLNMVVGWAHWIVYSIVYVIIAYMLVNSCFKLVDIIPDAAIKYLGGQRDASFSDNGLDGAIMAGSRVAQDAGQGAAKGAAKARGKAKQEQYKNQAKDRKAVDQEYAKLEG